MGVISVCAARHQIEVVLVRCCCVTIIFSLVSSRKHCYIYALAPQRHHVVMFRVLGDNQTVPRN